MEQGITPDTIMAKNKVGVAVHRTRPVCAWPQAAIYQGSGDVNDAASFRCGTRESSSGGMGFQSRADFALLTTVTKKSYSSCLPMLRALASWPFSVPSRMLLSGSRTTMEGMPRSVTLP